MADEEMMMVQQPVPPFYGQGQRDNSTIAELRWKDNELVSYVEETLGGYIQAIDEKGQLVRKRPEYFKPKINDEGLSGVISFLRAHLNPAIVLSNFDDDKANVLIRIQLIEFAKWLAFNQERFEIDRGDMALIQGLIRPIVVSQVYRAVGGHETRNFHTQALEHNVSQNSTFQNNQQGSFWPFGGHRR